MSTYKFAHIFENILHIYFTLSVLEFHRGRQKMMQRERALKDSGQERETMLDHHLFIYINHISFYLHSTINTAPWVNYTMCTPNIISHTLYIPWSSLRLTPTCSSVYRYSLTQSYILLLLQCQIIWLLHLCNGLIMNFELWTITKMM